MMTDKVEKESRWNREMPGRLVCAIDERGCGVMIRYSSWRGYRCVMVSRTSLFGCGSRMQ